MFLVLKAPKPTAYVDVNVLCNDEFCNQWQKSRSATGHQQQLHMHIHQGVSRSVLTIRTGQRWLGTGA